MEGRPSADEHLTETTPDKPAPTLDDLQPLYQAVAHGRHAGMQQEACDKVYFERIVRGSGSDGFYSMNKLGAFGADLGAVACFFDPPWRRVSTNLTPPDQAWLFGQAALHLEALGRLAEAQEPMRAALDLVVEREDWKQAAIAGSNLVELELTLGDIGAAIRDGERAVAHADRSGDAFQRMGNPTTHASALHQAGRRAEAQALFGKAEAMQAERQAGYPLLYSVQGFRYCDLLLAEAERAAWRRMCVQPVLSTTARDEAGQGSAVGSKLPGSGLGRGTETLQELLEACRAVQARGDKMFEWRIPADPLLDIGLDHLTLARAALYTTILGGKRPAGTHMREAADFLRRAGQQDYLPGGLLTSAFWRAASGAFDGAREDLDEAFEIAERGPMRLHLADIHLHRARLFGLMANRPAVYPWVSARDDLDKARRLIDECGYGRWREELADAEAAWERVYGAAGPGGAN